MLRGTPVRTILETHGRTPGETLAGRLCGTPERTPGETIGRTLTQIIKQQ
jgi:hypothetical protein